MREGPWHQLGSQSQTLALDLLQRGKGSGVIFSPRYLTFEQAASRAEEYHDLEACVLFDPQFYGSGWSNRSLDSYPTGGLRVSICKSSSIDDDKADRLTAQLVEVCGELECDAIIAPAVIYAAGRRDIVELNKRLFRAAREAGNHLGVATYATVMLGRSVTQSDATLYPILSDATSINADGWYFGFEFPEERVPSDLQYTLRCCHSCLLLASTGKPVMHAFAGLMAILTSGVGANAVGIGATQKLWRLEPSCWEQPGQSWGDSSMPQRFFSTGLWGTIVHPDETQDQRVQQLQEEILTLSPFTVPWTRRTALRHLVYMISSTVEGIYQQSEITDRFTIAVGILDDAMALHGRIAATGLRLRDNTNAYQANWRQALQRLQDDFKADLDYLRLISSLESTT